MDIKYYKKIFLTPGIASYKDNGDGVLLIQKETIDKYLDTLKNKDVIITHDGKDKVGEVVDAYYDIKTGAYVCGFNIWDEKAKDLLDNKNYSISCFYNILQEGKGGIHHNIPYDSEALEIEFENIAIVDNPRYEEAKKVVNSILPNNNDKGEKKMEDDKVKTENLTPDQMEEVREDKEDLLEDKVEDVKNTEPTSKHTIDELYELMLSIVGKLEGWDKEEYKSEEITDEEPIENSTQEQKQQASTGDKVLQEDFIKKDVVKPIANAIKKKILNSNGDMITFKSRRDRIKESNKKFFNNN